MSRKVVAILQIMFIFTLFSLFAFSVQAADKKKTDRTFKIEKVRKAVNTSILSADPSYRLSHEYKQLKNKQDKINQALRKTVQSKQKAMLLQKSADSYLTGADRIKYFMLEIKRMRAAGSTTAGIQHTLQQRFSLQKSPGSGSISGIITMGGAIPNVDVLIFAFDLYGYYIAETQANFSDGTYELDNLPAGSYYILTESNLADEFYNNVPFNNYKGWRNADHVAVTSAQVTPDVNFDLDSGAVISGKVFDETTGSPLVFFVINVYDMENSSEPLYTDYLFPNIITGEYSFNFGKTGYFKISAEFSGYKTEFYHEQPDWNSADPVYIASPTDTIRNIDFTLVLDTGTNEVDSSSMISGSVIAEDNGAPLLFVLLFAFDTSDTSIAGFTISMPFLGKRSTQAPRAPNYQITGLAPGNYIVMATDLLQGYSREFYRESPTPDGAAPVSLAKADTATAIDFTLDRGASISGTVTNEAGEPLSNVAVLAIKGDLENFDGFFTNIDVGFDTTDDAGRYQITGISDGDYLIRTISLMNDNYNGMYLDEWYSDVHSIFAFGQANKVSVTVPDTTGGIDFVLEKASVISGKILAADGVTPVEDVTMVVAIDTATYLPQLAPFEYGGGNDGSYTISMLEPGEYTLFALVDPSRDNMYISEFYDGKASIGSADVVAVAFGDTTKNINFTLEQGGVIQGFVNLAAQYHAGADTVSDIPVVAYEVATGRFAGAAAVTFSGGYRIIGIPPGSYKLAVLPVLSPHAVTYFGGGNTFDDPNSQPVVVVPGNTQDIDFQLEQAQGAIRGICRYAEDGTPLNQALVFAYDATGHAVGVGMAGVDIMSHLPTENPGMYEIPNLRTGSYYVRTFALFSILNNLTNPDLASGDISNPFSILGGFGDLFGPVAKDEWYDGVVVDLPDLSFDSVFGFLQTIKYDIFGFMPFFDTPPAGAQMVSVVDGGSATENINFSLGTFSFADVSVSVEDSDLKTTPHSFQLGQSYPNPVARQNLAKGVTIRFQVPERSFISVSIYNILGQKIATLLNKHIVAGSHNLHWNGRDNRGSLLPSGIYFYSLQTDTGMKQMKKLVVLK